jgi:hypothetical protein
MNDDIEIVINKSKISNDIEVVIKMIIYEHEVSIHIFQLCAFIDDSFSQLCFLKRSLAHGSFLILNVFHRYHGHFSTVSLYWERASGYAEVYFPTCIIEKGFYKIEMIDNN